MSLKEIAKMTGVSVSTVGRILNDPTHKCQDEDVKRRVLEAAREISYIPNASARSLKSGQAHFEKIYHINILLTRFADEAGDPFYDELLILLEQELRNSGGIINNVWHSAELSDSRKNDRKELESIVGSLYSDNEHRSDGLIIIGKITKRALALLKTYEKNMISINRNPNNSEVDEVICDGRKLAREAVAYLAKLGHNKIGYVGDCYNEARFMGYQAAIGEFHLTNDLDYIYDTTPNESHGLSAMEYFRGLSDPPTAIYCANDILAVGMIKGLGKRRHGGYYPSIISCDDIDAAQYTKPMLTTISLPKFEMSRFALMLLLDRIKGGHKTVSRLELGGTLIVRESCRPLSDMNEPEYYI